MSPRDRHPDEHLRMEHCTANYQFLPFILNEASTSPRVTVSIWSPDSKCWEAILPDELDGITETRFCARDHDIQIVLVQKFEFPTIELKGEMIKAKFGHLASITLRNWTEQGSNPGQMDEDSMIFQPLYDSLVFSVREDDIIQSQDIQANKQDIKIALDVMLRIRRYIDSLIESKAGAWFKIDFSGSGSSSNGLVGKHQGDKETPCLTSSETPSRTHLQPSNHDHLDILVNSLEITNRYRQSLSENTKTSQGDSSIAVSNLPNSMRHIKEMRLVDSMQLHDVTKKPENLFYGCNMEAIDVFIWCNSNPSWENVIPKESTSSSECLPYLQVFSDGIEVLFTHQIPVSESNNTSIKATHNLGKVKWRLQPEEDTVIPFHIRWKDIGVGEAQPIFYLALPLRASAVLYLEENPHIDLRASDSLSRLLEDMLTRIKESSEKPWLCVKSPNSKDGNMISNILRARASRFSEVSVALVPRRSKENKEAAERYIHKYGLEVGLAKSAKLSSQTRKGETGSRYQVHNSAFVKPATVLRDVGLSMDNNEYLPIS